MALNITGADSLCIQQQPHINKQAAEHDGQRLNRSGNAGPAAVFSFSQQALDSAKDVDRSQPGNRSQLDTPTGMSPARFEYGAPSVETTAALRPTPPGGELHATRAEAPRREQAEARADARAADRARQVSYDDLLGNVARSLGDYFS